MAGSSRWFGLVAMVAIGTMAHAQLTDAERKKIEANLFLQNLSVRDLIASRADAQDAMISPTIREMIENPMLGIDRAYGWHASSNTASLIDLYVKALRVSNPDQETGSASLPPIPNIKTLKGPIREVVSQLVAAMNSADEEIAAGLVQLSPAERLEAINLLTAVAKAGLESVSPTTQKRLETLMSRVELDRIENVGVGLIAAIDEAREALQTSIADVPAITTLSVNGISVTVVPRKGGSIDATGADLVILLGGENHVKGTVAGGIGRSSVLLDLGESSTYQTGDRSLGCGVLGIGIAQIAAGDSIFRAGALSLGSGIGGVGVFHKVGGEDVYRSGLGSQGFGLSGLGIHLDTGGSDFYRASAWAQGAGRNQGTGWLVDLAGDDRYESDGVIRGSKLQRKSFSQGYGAGTGYLAPDSPGGIGLLSDHGGTDRFVAESDAQGAATWQSCGSIFAKRGNSSFIARKNAQGYAAHQSFAALIDSGGDDTLSCLGGAGQATAVDESVAFWVDQGGIDQSMQDQRLAGVAFDNSLSVSVKAEGVRSSTTVATADRISASPFAVKAVNSLSVAPGSESNAQPVALAMDDDDALSVPSSLPKPGSATARGAESIAAMWEKAVTPDSSALGELVGQGKLALDWAVANRLSKARAIDLRIMVFLAAQIGKQAAAASFAPLLTSNDESQLRNGMLVAMAAEIPDLIAIVPRISKSNPNLRVTAARLVGKLKDKSAVEALAAMLLDPDLRVQREAMQALAIIGNDAAVGSAQARLSTPDLGQRLAVLELLQQFPKEAEMSAKALLGVDDEHKVRLALQLLARVGSPETLSEVSKFLTDKRAGVRLTAVVELEGRIPPDAKKTFAALVTDPDPVVREAARKVKL